MRNSETRGWSLLIGRDRRNPERLLIEVALAIVAFLFIWFQLDLLLLAFAGILVAVVLRAITNWIERHTRLNGAFAYAATLFFIGAFLVGIGVLLAPHVIAQISEVANSMPSSIRRLEAPLEGSSWGRQLLAQVHRLLHGSSLSSGISQIAAALSSGVTDFVVVIVIGFFAALSPRGYREGALLLLPESDRAKARRIASDLQHQLKWWLLGQMVPMIALGVASGIGLSLLGVHLPWTLGLLTGVAVFLPYAGTILAGIPSVLMGLQRGPHTALYVLILYTFLHVAEGYILTPFVQRRAVRLPPVLTILAQYFLWSVAGILGLALAAPLAGAGIVLVKELYLHVPPDQDVLPDSGTPSSRAA